MCPGFVGLRELLAVSLEFMELGVGGECPGRFLGMICPMIAENRQLGPVYTTVEKASGRSRMLGQGMVI